MLCLLLSTRCSEHNCKVYLVLLRYLHQRLAWADSLTLCCSKPGQALLASIVGPAQMFWSSSTDRTSR